ncbi:MAG: VOC family protein [Dehalococcoidia bacterium]|nr:VOC family protein [Dehalococcoidia bacterium]
MIDFKRIDHIGMVVADLEAQAALFSDLLGLERLGEWEDEADAARGITFALPEGDLHWEVSAPTAPDSPLQAFLESPRGPGLHHITFEVADLEAVRSALRALGVREADGSNGERVLVSADGAGEGLQMRFRATLPALTPPVAGQPADRRAGDEQPSLGIEALDHVSTAYRDRDELSRHYGRLLGMRQVWRTPDGAWPDFADCVLEMPGGQIGWEVIQPVGDDSFITKFLDARGPAPHHVAFRVRDFDAALAACEQRGVPTFDVHDDQTDGHRWRDAFIHPRHTGGLLTQIFWEAHPGVWERSDKVRPEGYIA